MAEANNCCCQTVGEPAFSMEDVQAILQSFFENHVTPQAGQGVTQYVGARYVPIFAEPAEWDNTRAYEPLTIVMHQGNSYTSRQTVPIGIDIANESFWALTGNYNAQVEQYRKEVERYKQEVLSFNNRITTAQSTADTANTTANEALSLAQTNERDISALDDQMAGTSDSGLKTWIEEQLARVNTSIDNINSNMNTVNTSIDNINSELNKLTSAKTYRAIKENGFVYKGV